MNKDKILSLKNLIIVLIIIFLTTLFAYSLQEFGIRLENILLVYIIAVMIIIIETKKFILGFTSTIICVFIFNFLFIDPKYTFIINDANYIISMIIFILVSFIISSLASRLQKQIKISYNNQEKVEVLYQMSKKLLFIHSIENIVNFELKHLNKYLNRNITIYIKYQKYEKVFKIDDFIDLKKYQHEIEWCLHSFQICGYNESQFPNLSFKMLPLKSNKGNLGVLIVDCENKDISDEEKQFLQVAISHMNISLEREFISTQEETIRIEMENEKFKTSLLRSISHDLRTPLTSLSAGSSLLIDNYDTLDDDTKKSILVDINNETSYLSSFVENLLNMTRIDANKLNINKKREVIEDIVSDVSSRVSKRLGKHKLEVISPEEMIFIYCDAQLIVQVLVNLIDNAVKHTKANSKIIIKYYQDNKYTWFEVIDNGGGIDSNKLENIFNEFISIYSDKSDKNRGVGLGLSICKGIVEAHKGNIIAFNNDVEGMTFKFKIPLKKEDMKR